MNFYQEFSKDAQIDQELRACYYQGDDARDLITKHALELKKSYHAFCFLDAVYNHDEQRYMPQQVVDEAYISPTLVLLSPDHTLFLMHFEISEDEGFEMLVSEVRTNFFHVHVLTNPIGYEPLSIASCMRILYALSNTTTTRVKWMRDMVFTRMISYKYTAHEFNNERPWILSVMYQTLVTVDDNQAMFTAAYPGTALVGFYEMNLGAVAAMLQAHESFSIANVKPQYRPIFMSPQNNTFSDQEIRNAYRTLWSEMNLDTQSQFGKIQSWNMIPAKNMGRLMYLWDDFVRKVHENTDITSMLVKNYYDNANGDDVVTLLQNAHQWKDRGWKYVACIPSKPEGRVLDVCVSIDGTDKFEHAQSDVDIPERNKEGTRVKDVKPVSLVLMSRRNTYYSRIFARFMNRSFDGFNTQQLRDCTRKILTNDSNAIAFDAWKMWILTRPVALSASVVIGLVGLVNQHYYEITKPNSNAGRFLSIMSRIPIEMRAHMMRISIKKTEIEDAVKIELFAK